MVSKNRDYSEDVESTSETEEQGSSSCGLYLLGSGVLAVAAALVILLVCCCKNDSADQKPEPTPTTCGEYLNLHSETMCNAAKHFYLPTTKSDAWAKTQCVGTDGDETSCANTSVCCIAIGPVLEGLSLPAEDSVEGVLARTPKFQLLLANSKKALDRVVAARLSQPDPVTGRVEFSGLQTQLAILSEFEEWDKTPLELTPETAVAAAAKALPDGKIVDTMEGVFGAENPVVVLDDKDNITAYLESLPNAVKPISEAAIEQERTSREQDLENIHPGRIYRNTLAVVLAFVLRLEAISVLEEGEKKTTALFALEEDFPGVALPTPSTRDVPQMEVLNAFNDLRSAHPLPRWSDWFKNKFVRSLTQVLQNLGRDSELLSGKITAPFERFELKNSGDAVPKEKLLFGSLVSRASLRPIIRMLQVEQDVDSRPPKDPFADAAHRNTPGALMARGLSWAGRAPGRFYNWMMTPTKKPLLLTAGKVPAWVQVIVTEDKDANVFQDQFNTNNTKTLLQDAVRAGFEGYEVGPDTDGRRDYLSVLRDGVLAQLLDETFKVELSATQAGEAEPTQIFSKLALTGKDGKKMTTEDQIFAFGKDKQFQVVVDPLTNEPWEHPRVDKTHLLLGNAFTLEHFGKDVEVSKELAKNNQILPLMALKWLKENFLQKVQPAADLDPRLQCGDFDRENGQTWSPFGFIAQVATCDQNKFKDTNKDGLARVASTLKQIYANQHEELMIQVREALAAGNQEDIEKYSAELAKALSADEEGRDDLLAAQFALHK